MRRETAYYILKRCVIFGTLAIIFAACYHIFGYSENKVERNYNTNVKYRPGLPPKMPSMIKRQYGAKNNQYSQKTNQFNAQYRNSQVVDNVRKPQTQIKAPLGEKYNMKQTSNFGVNRNVNAPVGQKSDLSYIDKGRKNMGSVQDGAVQSNAGFKDKKQLKMAPVGQKNRPVYSETNKFDNRQESKRLALKKAPLGEKNVGQKNRPVYSETNKFDNRQESKPQALKKAPLGEKNVVANKFPNSQANYPKAQVVNYEKINFNKVGEPPMVKSNKVSSTNFRNLGDKNTDTLNKQKLAFASSSAERPIIYDKDTPMAGKIVNDDKTIRNNDFSPIQGKVMEDKTNLGRPLLKDNFGSAASNDLKMRNNVYGSKDASIINTEESAFKSIPGARSNINAGMQLKPYKLAGETDRKQVNVISTENNSNKNLIVGDNNKQLPKPWKKHETQQNNLNAGTNADVQKKRDLAAPKGNINQLNNNVNKKQMNKNNPSPIYVENRRDATVGKKMENVDKPNVNPNLNKNIPNANKQAQVQNALSSNNAKSNQEKMTVSKNIKYCNVRNLNLPWPVSESMRCDLLKAYKPPVVMCLYSSNEDAKISKVLQEGNIWDPETHRDIEKFLARTKSLGFIDIGANIGGHSLHIATLGYKVLAVEPLSKNVDRIHKAAKLNNVADNIVLLQNRISDTRLPAGKDNFSTIFMNDLLEVIQFKQAVMRIDTEGLEPKTLSRSAIFFSSVHIPAIFVEWKHLKPWFNEKTSDGWNDVMSMLAELKTRGYTPLEIGIDDLARGMLDPSNWGEWPNEIKFILRNHL